ncbi:CheR family methyltransferase [Variovorax paradoxus]|uniref:CheR family methyltransferase n=1 Tax=Variovorax paradoxus TaxID=34073 RepID=UPI0029C8D2DC|nr:CheR family methyltransferase [Variovorax paradoxus]
MDVAPFEQLLKQTMGLDAASIGSAVVRRAVQERLAACRLPDAQAYWERLGSSAPELQELIEAVVVPETWFFRDPASFAALARLAGEDGRAAQGPMDLRLLSVPCATGEEPYSMAMALLDAGFPESALRIDAVDISTRALARAQAAVYGRNSFRGSDLAFRDRHFVATAGGHGPVDAVRRRVQFRHGNLLDGLMAEAERYDVIFCRNVLIYFDRATQDRAIAVLTRLLKPRGWLFVGPSETALLSDHGFISAKLPLAFAFRKGPAAGSDTKLRATPAPFMPVRTRAPVSAAPPTPAARLRMVPAPAAMPRAVAAPAEASTGIDRARRLADQGHLADAAAHCEAHLRRHGPSAEVFHLLGLVRDASGNAEDAADQYRKALYLEPDHHEALVHLALLLRKRGDEAGAQRLQRRAGRLHQGGGA